MSRRSSFAKHSLENILEQGPLEVVPVESDGSEDSGCCSLPSPADIRALRGRRSSLPAVSLSDFNPLLGLGSSCRPMERRLSLNKSNDSELNNNGACSEKEDDDMISEELSRHLMEQRQKRGNRSLSMMEGADEQLAIAQMGNMKVKHRGKEQTAAALKKERDLNMIRRSSANNIFKPINAAKQAKQEWYNAWKIRSWKSHDLNKNENTFCKKYDQNSAASILQWIRSVTREPINCNGDPDNFRAVLEDGALFAQLLSEIKPGIIGDVSTVYGAFGSRDLIVKCLEACKEMGISDEDLFAPDDLIESLDLSNVVVCLHMIGLKARLLCPKLPKLRILNRSSSYDTYVSAELEKLRVQIEREDEEDDN